jgi:O-antigen/teichoic acid export membrane protein
MKEMIRDEVGKGAIFLYIQLVASMISGYVFIILLSKITTTEVIGTYSLLVAISEVFANVVIIGLADSIQRFVGKSLLRGKVSEAKIYVKIALIFLSVSIAVSSIVILLIRDWLSSIFGIRFEYVVVIEMLVASYAIYTVVYSIVVASLKTKILPIIIAITSISKVILALSLVLMGTGVLGISLGYTFFGQALSSILLGVFIFRMFTSTKEFEKLKVSIKNASKNLLIGGLVIWIPALITTLGIDLGTLVLYKNNGPYQSGIYFLTLAIVNAIHAIVYSVYTISLPALSSMDDGRKRFAWNMIRLCAIIVLPLSSAMIFYSREILGLVGTNYIEGSLTMEILLLSTFPVIVLSGIETLIYSYGKYRYTISINLASSVPRTILYFVLVPLFGMTGVAISYTIGSVIGFIVSAIISRKIDMKIFWKRLGLTLFIPISLAFIFQKLNVNYVIAIFITIVLSYLILAKLHILGKSDGAFLIELMPSKISKSLIAISNKFEKVIDWFFK